MNGNTLRRVQLAVVVLVASVIIVACSDPNDTKPQGTVIVGVPEEGVPSTEIIDTEFVDYLSAERGQNWDCFVYSGGVGDLTRRWELEFNADQSGKLRDVLNGSSYSLTWSTKFGELMLDLSDGTRFDLYSVMLTGEYRFSSLFDTERGTEHMICADTSNAEGGDKGEVSVYSTLLMNGPNLDQTDNFWYCDISDGGDFAFALYEDGSGTFVIAGQGLVANWNRANDAGYSGMLSSAQSWALSEPQFNDENHVKFESFHLEAIDQGAVECSRGFTEDDDPPEDVDEPSGPVDDDAAERLRRQLLNANSNYYWYCASADETSTDFITLAFTSEQEGVFGNSVVPGEVSTEPFTWQITAADAIQTENESGVVSIYRDIDWIDPDIFSAVVEISALSMMEQRYCERLIGRVEIGPPNVLPALSSNETPYNSDTNGDGVIDSFWVCVSNTDSHSLALYLNPDRTAAILDNENETHNGLWMLEGDDFWFASDNRNTDVRLVDPEFLEPHFLTTKDMQFNGESLGDGVCGRYDGDGNPMSSLVDQAADRTLNRTADRIVESSR